MDWLTIIVLILAVCGLFVVLGRYGFTGSIKREKSHQDKVDRWLDR